MIFVDAMLANKEAFMLAYKIRQQDQYNKIYLVDSQEFKPLFALVFAVCQ